MHADEISARLQEISQRLNDQRFVRPGASRSNVPVIGPAITGVRRLWSNLATRWYVDPLVSDANRFSEAVTHSFDDLAALLVEMVWEIEADREVQGGLQNGLASLEEQLQTLKELRHAGSHGQALGASGPTAATEEAAPRTQASADEECYWDDHAYASLLRAKEEILTRHPGEEEEVYLERFEADGAEHASWLAPYHDAESSVLEIGCGIGRILKHVPAKERWGVDISQGMLEWAAIYLAEQEGIHLVKTNGFDLADVPSEHIDLVYSLLVIQHMNKRAGYSYMCETHRVLKPGGRFYFQLMCLTMAEGFRQFEAAVPVDYRYCPLYFYTEDEVRYKLGRIGFEIDRLYCEGDSLYVIGHKPAA